MESPQKSHRSWNWLIVAAAVTLVLGPVLWGQLDGERARWHLAAAANALEIQGSGYQDELDKAAKSVSDVTELRDYWLFRIDQALREDIQSVPKILTEAKAKNASFASLGVHAAQKISRMHAKNAVAMFPLLVQVIELIQSAEQREQPDNLNALAYYRSVAAVDLDRALEDINKALGHFPNRAEYRDTRAWVLHQMGRPIEALDDAQFAADTYSTHRSSGLLGSFGQVLNEFFPEDPKTEAVIRFHRGRILETLGRTDEAKADWDWIEQHKIPIDDNLY